MPSFQKIGGLLTHSMPGDAASLHAAVIAINRALSEKVIILIVFVDTFQIIIKGTVLKN